MITPDTRTWSSVLENFQEFFQGHAETGVHLDADLCAAFAEGLGDVREAMVAVESYVESVVPSKPRSHMERRRLVGKRLSLAGTNVVQLPPLDRDPSTFTVHLDGGDAA